MIVVLIFSSSCDHVAVVGIINETSSFSLIVRRAGYPLDRSSGDDLEGKLHELLNANLRRGLGQKAKHSPVGALPPTSAKRRP